MTNATDIEEVRDMETVAPAKLLMSAEEAARALGIGRTRMYELLRSGEVASIKLGRSRRIRPEDLEEYVERLVLGEEKSM
jgi:excisionase family DNA binding protein